MAWSGALLIALLILGTVAGSSSEQTTAAPPQGPIDGNSTTRASGFPTVLLTRILPTSTATSSPTAIVSSATPTQTETPTEAPTSTSSPVPPTATPTKVPLARYIEGLTADTILAAVKTRPGMRCTGPSYESALGKTEAYWDCSLEGPSVYQYEVTIIGDSPTQIKEIDAEFANYGSLSTKAIAPQFLNPLATLGYKNSDPARVKDWLVQSLGSADSDLFVASAYFGLAVPSDNFVLLVIRSRAQQGE